MESDFDLTSYDFIGFSMLSDTLPTTAGVIELVRKKYPRAKLVAGNHEASVNFADCVGKTRLDGVVLADAEEPMLALLRGEEPSRIPGVLWRNFNPKPSREQFEEWNRLIRWNEIPFSQYWNRTSKLYPLDEMTEEERLDKLYEIRTVRVHSLNACELACTYSLCGDSLVFTDEGPVEIASLMTGIGVVRECVHGAPFIEHRLDREVASPAGRALATVVLDEGIRPVLRVATEGGFSIKATPEHRFLCAENDQLVWKRSDELRVDNFVVIRQPDHMWATEYQKLQTPVFSARSESRLKEGGRCPEVLDERLAWLVGFVIGDGCIPSNDDPTIHFCVFPNLEAKQRAVTRELFGTELHIYRVKHSDKLMQGQIHSRRAREVLTQSIGVDPFDKLKIPPIIWKSPRAVALAFVEGLLDADAYDPSAPGRHEYLTTVSERLAREFALLLLTLGCCPNVQRIEFEGKISYRVSVFQQERIPSTRSVYLSKSGWRWRTLKQASANNNGCVGIRRSTLRKSGLHHSLDRDGWYYMRVQSVETCLPERVYDLTVPGEEAFVANGFVAHNCSVANTRRIASGSMKPSIINLSSSALEENFLAIKRQVPGVMTIYDSSDEAWLGRGRADEYLATIERIKPIMDEGLPRGLRWLIQCRSQDLDERIIDRAAKAGVKHLTIGVESPIERVRKDIKKPQSEELIRNIARWCTERDVNAYMLFIMFLPSITLEELRVAVDNWRIYMELGATISVEPFCMSYIGTALHDDPRYLTEYVGYEIPFSGTPPKRLKWATLIWPEDRRVCAVLQWFRDHVDSYIEAALQRLGHRHAFKGTTGRVTVDCLEEALRLWDLGQIPPWEPGVGRRSAVYQDYGDQMSGSEIAAAASQMLRPNKTASRFNSTHSLLDDVNAGVRGRIKDPALPHEMLPKPPGEDAE